jgi:hypothetical protein
LCNQLAEERSGVCLVALHFRTQCRVQFLADLEAFIFAVQQMHGLQSVEDAQQRLRRFDLREQSIWHCILDTNQLTIFWTRMSI